MQPPEVIQTKIKLLIKDLEMNGYRENVHDALLEYYLLLDVDQQRLIDKFM